MFLILIVLWKFLNQFPKATVSYKLDFRNILLIFEAWYKIDHLQLILSKMFHSENQVNLIHPEQNLIEENDIHFNFVIQVQNLTFHSKY